MVFFHHFMLLYTYWFVTLNLLEISLVLKLSNVFLFYYLSQNTKWLRKKTKKAKQKQNLHYSYEYYNIIQ